MMRYLTKQEVYLLHKAIMKRHGDESQAGIRDQGIFESAIERPKSDYFGKEIYPDLFDKAAVLIDSLTNNHPFYNGNKRTAYAATKAFLRLNGYHLKMTKDAGIELMVKLATNEIDVPNGVAVAEFLRKRAIKTDQ